MALDPSTALVMSFVVPIAMFLLNQIFNRGDKSESKYEQVAKNVGEMALQLASLRTELAQQELARQREMEMRFVLRREFDVHVAVVDFTKRLTVEVHRRMWPEASIHEPGGQVA